MKKYEVLVIGAGHAGIEAAFAIANKKHKVGLVSLDINKVALMPCNPSIGGPAKGIITREIDVLGGMQAIFADQAMIQIKMLNESRGPAVRALRAQIDKNKYTQIVKKAILSNPYIDFIEEMTTELIVDDHVIKGIKTTKGIIKAKVVILTTGTYMDSSILRGLDQFKAGPDGQKTTSKLSKSIEKLDLKMQRLKTGTPPRIYANSIDWSELKKEILPKPDFNFSFRQKTRIKNQVYCYLGYSNPQTHKIIMNNLNKSSMYSGQFKGVGPRYCPSFEDKVVRFADKNRHQLFYEPETIKQDTIYLQGLSSSMPIDVQKKVLKTLPGLKNAQVQKWAYAIEYDAILPSQLKPSLELKKVKNLFFAGQVNGTSGYEEAAAQGLIAGINAALKLENKKSIIIPRDKGYIGVLIDDLVTKGTNEPYRMLTSRAEYRLLLRNDNADERLVDIAFNCGMINKSYYEKVKVKYKSIYNEIIKLKNSFLSSNNPLAKKYNINSGPSLANLLTRPEIDIANISNFKYIYEVSVRLRLEGYIKKQEIEAKKMQRLNNFKIPHNIDYKSINNLASEAKQKLIDIQPETIGQAYRISGINPSDIQMIMFYLEYKKVKNK